jgi:bifunctional non-homologous end joining protein LigD
MYKLAFVIHKHRATALHYDFRIQVGKSMPSWAIPKGPTLDPKLKRLSVKVGDHDLEYRNFEGNLPEGSEGEGPVMIWDEGYYIPEIEIAPGKRELIKDIDKGEKTIREGIKKGEIKFFLHGKKIKGSFALVKTKNFPPGSTKDNWLMIKHKDQYCKENYDAKNEDFSARSGKSLANISKA